MAHASTVSVPAATQGVPQALEAFRAWSDGQHVAPATRRDLLTAIDEVLTNIVRHGTPRRRDTVSLRFSLDRSVLKVEVSDRRAAFNPLEWPLPDTTAGLDARTPGGLGIALIRGLVDEVTYERRRGMNRLTLTVRTLRS